MKQTTLFLSHGGGPLPLFGDAGHEDMVDCLQSIAAEIDKPSAIVLISAHWEEEVATITSSLDPSLIYDYYGFPEASYQIAYPCPGQPVLATQIYEVLENAGIRARRDPERGLDHGVFVPLKLMYPDADIPCVQLSLLSSLDPAEHLKIGRALQSLTLDKLLVIGSGFSFHNMQAFFTPDNPGANMMNSAFESWLLETCCSSDISEEQRWLRLMQWSEAPYARFCHPREEHLLPLHVCYGLAARPCSRSFELSILNKKASMYLWSESK